jgi:tetratricopeptide (TPR) repeat protein
MFCAGDSATRQDLADSAELMLTFGFIDTAQLLYTLFLIRLGFSPARMKDHAEISARAGLRRRSEWLNWPAARHHAPVHSMDIANSELRQIVNLVLDAPPLPEQGAYLATAIPAASNDESVFQGVHHGTCPGDLAWLCEQLYGLLRQQGGDETWQKMAELLAHLRQQVLDQPPFDLRRQTNCPIPILGARAAFNILQRFLLSNFDLAYGPFGSATVFHLAGRMNDAGLGAYFANMAHLIRSGRDVLAVIQRAIGNPFDAAQGLDVMERWSVLLSVHLRGQALHELVDELGDTGLMRAIWGVLSAATREQTAAPDRALLWRIRDCALDNNYWELASHAQQAILNWWPEPVEWIVLGEIEATAGNLHDARQAFLRALSLDPNHHGGRERLAALRGQQFEKFRVIGGFGTAPSRKLLRFHRRNARQANSRGT